MKRNWRRGVPVPQMTTSRAIHLSLMKAPDESRNHVAVLGMVVVAWAMEVRRHNASEVHAMAGAVLAVEALAQLDASELCCSVRFVRGIGIPKPSAGRFRTAEEDTGAGDMRQWPGATPGRPPRRHGARHWVLSAANAPWCERSARSFFIPAKWASSASPCAVGCRVTPLDRGTAGEAGDQRSSLNRPLACNRVRVVPFPSHGWSLEGHSLWVVQRAGGWQEPEGGKGGLARPLGAVQFVEMTSS